MKLHKYCDICLLFLYSLIFLIFLKIAFQFSGSHLGYIKQLGRNWKRPIITDIYEYKNNTLLKSRKYFENENDCYPLISRNWKGTKKGCYCKNILLSNVLNDQECGDKMMCSEINPIPEKSFSKWENNKICIEKEETLNYLSMTIVGESSKCKSGFKACGYIDSNYNILCVERYSDCPIKAIQVSDTKKNDYESISLENGKYLLFKKGNNFTNNEINDTKKENISENDDLSKYIHDYRYRHRNKNSYYYRFNKNNDEKTQSNIIYIDFIIDEDTPCIIDNQYNNVHELYLLDNMKKNACEMINNEKYDYNTIKIDTMNYLKLLQDNFILDSLLTLPEFNSELYNFNVGLFAKNYVGVDYKCHLMIKNVITEEVLNSWDTINSNEISIILIIILVILSLVNIVFNLFSFFSPDYDKDKEFKLFGTIAISVIILILLTCLFYSNQEKFKREEIMEDASCVNQYTTSSFKTYFENIEFVNNLCYIVAVIYILSAIVIIVSYSLNYRSSSGM